MQTEFAKLSVRYCLSKPFLRNGVARRRNPGSGERQPRMPLNFRTAGERLSCA